MCSSDLMEPGSTPSWQISKRADGVIYSRFVGPTRTEEFAGFLQALLLAMPAANARLVFDLRQLGGYNAETKEPMKAWLLQHKLAISELTVVVPQSGTILKMVSAAIGLATGVKIRVRDEPEAQPPFAAQ